VARLGRWAALLALAVSSLMIASPASAEPPSCEVHLYTGDPLLQIREGKPITLHLDCGWPLEPLSVASVTAPKQGDLSPLARDGENEEWVFTYTPDPGYVGDDTFGFVVTDGEESSTVAATITVGPNRAPSCERRHDPVYDHVRLGHPSSMTFSCGDLDEQDYGALEAAVGVEPLHGTLGVEVALDPQTWEELLTVTYTPDLGFEGSEHFTAGVTDGDLTYLKDFHINVSDGPWCQPSEPVTVRAGDTVRVLPYCTAPTWEPLTTSVPTAPEHGSTSFVGMAIDYTADADASGEDSFTFQATGSDSVSNVVTQEVTILPNAAPTCDDVAVGTARDAAVAIPLTCSDPDGDDHGLALADQPAHGTLGELADGSVTYTPDPGWDGTDSFTYVASDFARTSGLGRVTVEVTEEDDPVVEVTVPDQSPARAARRGLRIAVSADEPVTADVVVGVPGRLAERLGIPRRIGRLQGVAIDHPRHVRVDLTRRAARAIRPLGRVRLAVDVVAWDEWGNAASVETRGVLR
jgi:hypothetical protein